MNLHQIAESWNGQVAKLCNWTINRLEGAADQGDVNATRTDRRQPSVKPRKFAVQEEYYEIRH